MIEAVTPLGTSGATALGEGVRPTQRPAAPAGEAQADFGAMLGQLAGGTLTALKNAEAVSLASVNGQASVQQVVEAVMSAEQALQGAIAVRDKIVSAYLELSRMSI